MTIVDTSVWIHHFKSGESALIKLLEADEVVMHPLIIGELALGSIPQKEVTLTDLGKLPVCHAVPDEEILDFIVKRKLAGRGIGIVDVHLIGAALANDYDFLTRDLKLLRVWESLS